MQEKLLSLSGTDTEFGSSRGESLVASPAGHSFSSTVRFLGPRSDLLLRFFFAVVSCLYLGWGVAQEESSSPGEDGNGEEAAEVEEGAKPFRILLIQGGANHPYKQRGEILRKGIEERVQREIEWTAIGDLSGRSDVEIPELQDPEWKWDFDLILHDHCYSRVTASEAVANILQPHQEGIPAVILHAALWSFPARSEGVGDWAELTGVELSGETILDGLKVSDTPAEGAPFNWSPSSDWPTDEVYLLKNLRKEAKPLLSGKGLTSGVELPVAWTGTYCGEQARVMSTSLGNRTETLARPDFLDLLSRGVLWGLDAPEEWNSVAADESLAGLQLSPLPPALLRIGSGSGPRGVANALSENLAGGHDADRARDGDPATYWEADEAGPTFWTLQLPVEQVLSGIAVSGKDLEFPEMMLEVRSSETSWRSLMEVDAFVEEMKKGARLWRLSDPVRVSEIRITFPESRPGQRHGLREVVLYASPSEIPSVFDAGNPLASGDGLRTLRKPDRDPQIRLRAGWDWTSASLLPISRPPIDWFEIASGDLFLFPDASDTEAPRILLKRDSGAGEEWVPFLESLPDPDPVAAFWDGEWLGVVQDGAITHYRDSNGDGKADEKKNGGTIEIGEGERLQRLRLGVDGWCYGMLSRESGDIQGEIIRFHAGGGELQSLFSSPYRLESFWLEAPGKLWVQVREIQDGIPFRVLPLHEPILEADFEPERDSDVSAESAVVPTFFFCVDGSVSARGEAGEGAASTIRELVEVPSVLSVAGTGSRALVLHQETGGFRFSQLSQGVVDRPMVLLDEIANEDLPGYLDSSSPQVRVETVYELFRRKRDLTALVARTGADFSENGKIARLGYFSQLSSSSSLGYLVSAARTEQARVAFALLETHPSSGDLEVYRQILEIDEPDVTAQLLATLKRTESKREDFFPFLYDWTDNDSALLAGTAMSFLLRSEMVEALWEDLSEGENPAHALAMLRYLPKSETALRLLELVDQSTDPEFQRDGLRVLADLYQQSKKGSTEDLHRIEEFFQEALQSERFAPDFLLGEMQASGMSPGSLDDLLSLADKHLSFEPFVVTALESSGAAPSTTAVSWLEGIREDSSRDSLLRLRAYRLLLRSASDEEGGVFEFIEPLLSEVASRDLGPELRELWFEMRVEEHGLESLEKRVLESRSVQHREIFWTALWERIGSARISTEEKEQLVGVLDRRLSSDPGNSFELAKILLGAENVPARSESSESVESENEGEPEVEEDAAPRADKASRQENHLADLVREAIAARVGKKNLRIELPGASEEELVSRVEAVSPSLSLGWETFRTSHCADCHNIHREGRVIGPDIVAAAMEKSTAEFVGIFGTEEGNKSSPYRAYVLELQSGASVIGWILDESDGVFRLMDVAGNPFEVAENDIHLNRGPIGPQMGIKEKKTWTPDELASLRAFLRSLKL